MIRTKFGLLGLCALVLGVMSISAGSAQAALSWLILSASGVASNLKAPIASEKDSTHMTLLTKFNGAMISYTCTTNVELIGANLEVPASVTTGFKVKYTGCEAYEGVTTGTSLGTALNCQVHTPGAANGTIETQKLQAVLLLHMFAAGGSEVVLKVEPELGTLLANIQTSECGLPEENPVNGTFTLKDCEGKALVHQAKHLVVQGPLTSLYVGKDTAEHLETSLVGSIWIKLAGTHLNLNWAAMDA